MKLFGRETPLLLDGATGTNLMLRGMPQGVCVEQWVLEHPQVIEDIQTGFIHAGADIVYAPTFSANEAKLSHYGLEKQADSMNKALAAISINNAKRQGKGTLVAGDLSPTGLFCEPFGDTTFARLVEIYTRQAQSLKEAGVDLLVCETMMSLTDIRAALLGARKTGLPVFVTITVDENGRTLTGADPLSCLLVMQALGAAAFGLNCSTGPDKMAEHLKRLLPYARIPLIAKPNAGVPKAGAVHSYDMTPAQMAQHIHTLLKEGISIIGGCCGTTAEHLAAMRQVLDSFEGADPVSPAKEHLTLVTESKVFPLQEGYTVSPLIECDEDLEDSLMDAEDEEYDVIHIHVTSKEDAHRMALSVPMIHTPVLLTAEDADSLRESLLCYQGIALADKNSPIPAGELREIAAQYGAPIQ